MEFLGEGGGGGEAAGRVFLQALQAERVEVGGDLAVELRRRQRGVVEDLVAQQLQRTLAGEQLELLVGLPKPHVSWIESCRSRRLAWSSNTVSVVPQKLRSNHMPTIRLKAHFDGLAIQLDEQFELPRDAQLLVTVLPSAELEGETVSVSQPAEIDDWIREVETLAAEVDEEDGPRLQSAVGEIRRQARELARRGIGALP